MHSESFKINFVNKESHVNMGHSCGISMVKIHNNNHI